MCRLPPSLRRQPTTRKSTPKCGLSFAKTAREEGFDHIADLFEGVAKIEKEHEERYLKLVKNLEEGLVFSRDGDVVWQCANCGHIVIGKKAPEVCPVCAHPQLLI